MKKGVSLIAVLMFMLAATTASVVLFKWLSSENFASGSRLKQSEAYQASESGLDAVYAWLSYRAADVGAVMGDYLNQKNNRKAISLTSVLSSNLTNNLTSNHRYEVYLTDVGADKDNKIFKLKFLSVGIGRNNSKIAQEAVYNVEGLYKMERPVLAIRQSNEFNEQFWGNMGVVNALDVAKAVVTQSPSIKDKGKSQALNKIKIGSEKEPGYLVLDGNYYTNNGINIYGDLYATGSFDFCSTGSSNNDYIEGDVYIEGEFHPKGSLRITGDAYLKGGVNPNANANDAQGLTGGCMGQANGNVTIGGNSTIQKNFYYYNNGNGGGLGFDIAKTLLMPAGQIDLTRTTGNGADSLAVKNNVCIEKPIIGAIPDSERKPKPYFGKSASNFVEMPGNWVITTGSPNIFANNNIEIRSNVSGISTPNCSPKLISDDPNWWGADPMDGTRLPNKKNYKKKLSDAPNFKSCQNTPIQFNKGIYDKVKGTSLPWVHSLDRPGSCKQSSNGKLFLADPGSWADLGEELQKCWDDIENKGTQSTELYEGEWLVVYIRNKTQFNGGNKPLSEGKYIIINEMYTNAMADSICTNRNGNCSAGKCSTTDYGSTGCPPQELLLPPTGGDVSVMLYLPLGFPNKIRLGGTQMGAGYNYFIFSDYDIAVFDTESKTLRGNIFMNKCSTLNPGSNNSQNPSLTIANNPSLVEELMKDPFHIICENPDPKNPDHCLRTLGGNGGMSSSSSSDKKFDNYIIPIGPRLMVELESKSLSKKNAPKSSDTLWAKPSILVMPRVLNLAKNYVPNADGLINYYNILYLNGAEKENSLPSYSCVNDNEPGKSIPDEGVYTCSFTPPKISPFYVKIQGTDDDKPNITLTRPDKFEVGPGDEACFKVKASDKCASDMTVKLSEDNSGWTIKPATTVKISKNQMEYQVCVSYTSSNAKGSVTIKPATCSASGPCVTNKPKPDGECGTGLNSSVTISKKSDVEVFKIPISGSYAESNLWDCPASGQWSLTGNCQKQTSTNSSTDKWLCPSGENVELVPPGPQVGVSCVVITSPPGDPLTIPNITSNKTFEVAHKWKQFNLTVKGVVGSATFNTTYGNKPHAVTCYKDTPCKLYSGLNYTFSANGTYNKMRLNGIDLDVYEVTLTNDDNTLVFTNAGTGDCDYDPSWCNNYFQKGGDVPAYRNKKCFFAKSISQFCSGYNFSKINGISVGQGMINCWGGNKTLSQLGIEPADGGYYILSGDGTGEIPTFVGNIGESPSCPDKTHIGIVCSMPYNGRVEYNLREPIPSPTIEILNEDGTRVPCQEPAPIPATGCGSTMSNTNRNNVIREFYTFNYNSRDYEGNRNVNGSLKTTDFQPRWDCQNEYGFGTEGEDRAITLGKVTCKNTGNNTVYNFGLTFPSNIQIDVNYGVPGYPGILCGHITVKKPRCVVTRKCYDSAPATLELPYYECAYNGPATSAKFSFTASDSGSISRGDTLNDSFINTNVTARKNAKIYMYGLYCNGIKILTTGGPTDKSENNVVACEGTFSVGDPNCVENPTYILSCGNVPSTGTAGTAITPPTVTCNGSPVSSVAWGGSPSAPNWGTPAAGTYTSITATASCGGSNKTANCSGSLVVAAPSSSSVQSSSSEVRTITCSVAKTSVTQGENIPRPTISCSSGALSWTNAVFTGTPSTPQDVNNWRSSSGVAYYGTTVTGPNTIQAQVGCGSSQNPTGSCGTITVSKPTCSGVSGNVTVGDVITPTVGCGNATKSGNPTFDGGAGWNGSGSGGSYGSTGVGSRTIDLVSVTCDGHLITSITGVNCGSVTVAAATTYSLSCSAVPQAVTVGTSITVPTVTCTPSTGTASTVTNGLSWTNAPNWGSPAAGTYNVSVSASSGNCSGQTASCGTVVVSAAQPVCNASNAVDVMQTVTAGDCMKFTCGNSSGTLRLSDWNNQSITVNVTGACSLSNYTVPNNNDGTGSCNITNANPVFIQVKSGSTTNFAVGCW